MNWNNIVSGKRTGIDKSKTGIRTNYQVDFDRLIFSSAFRRLQDKTQVFPLPVSTFVHNRLTHSLEVASVGRSLGKIVGEKLIAQNHISKEREKFYEYELQNVIASACLAHDIGNPAFGHAGEKAISNYFIENCHDKIDGCALEKHFTKEEWTDLINFEGNANSFRILTHQFKGKSEGGYGLTYNTLASLLKYPCESNSMIKGSINTKKFSFFQAEKELGAHILETLNVIKTADKPAVFERHPFVFLTEAADDICYRIVDFEDAQRLHIIEHKRVADIFLSLIENIAHKDDNLDKINNTFKNITNQNEQISYLRAKCINTLTQKSSDLFIENADKMISGNYHSGLLDDLSQSNSFLQEIEDISIKEIYNHDTVVQLEIAGYRIMNDLLGLFIPAILKKQPGHKDKKVLLLLPEQFQCDAGTNYEKAFSVLDYLSGMTDSYSVDLYRKLFGIEIPKHS